MLMRLAEGHSADVGLAHMYSQPPCPAHSLLSLAAKGKRIDGSLAQDGEMLWVVQNLRTLEVHYFHCHILVGVLPALAQNDLQGYMPLVDV